MLEEVLRYLNNWFVVPGGVHTGTFTVENGGIVLPFLQNGQYFRIAGSLFNDGVYQYASDGIALNEEKEGAIMADETFEGVIWALAIPKAVLHVTKEIAGWNLKNGGPAAYTSESFGGYSYTRATNSRGVAAGWQDIFASQLSAWKKPAGSWQYAQPNPHMTPTLPCKDNPWR